MTEEVTPLVAFFRVAFCVALIAAVGYFLVTTWRDWRRRAFRRKQRRAERRRR